MSGNELIGKEELKSLQDIFNKSGGVLFAHGFEKRRNNIFRVKIFEKELSKFLKCKYVVSCSSGTAAGYLALKSLNIGKGDEVITQSFTFIAAVESILQTGATPVIIDCDDSLGIDPKELEKKITKKTKCIMPVHMLGESVDCNKILKISKSYKIPIVEDACESLGGRFGNKFLGTLGEIGFFSLDFGKVITTGEGGFLTTDNKKIYKKLKAMRDHGHENKEGVHRGLDKAIAPGFNYRMTEMQAAVGLAQLKKLKKILYLKKKNKNFLIKNIKEKTNKKKFKIRFSHNPMGEQFDHLVIHLSSAQKAKKVYKLLTKKNVNTGILPIASRWHYAGYWNHLWPKMKKNRKQFSKMFWKNTWNILSKSISIHIPILENKLQIEKKARIISAVINKI